MRAYSLINRLLKLISRRKETLVVLRHLREGGFLYLMNKIFLKLTPDSVRLFLAYAWQSPIGIPKSKDYIYGLWLVNHFPRKADLQRMIETVPAFSYQPMISIIMPVFNPPEAYLRQAIESVIGQVYPNWELCIADDASTDTHVHQVLKEYAEQEGRIKVVLRDSNGHISCASNSALALATGEFIALLDHDDLLTADALYEVVCLLNRHPEADMIYSDEDKVDDSGCLFSPYFKSDWCPDSFLSKMYTNHLGIYRRTLIEEIGGFRVGYEGAQDYDLVLRLSEKTQHIFHIPKILYHWRVHPQSTALGVVQKSYVIEATTKALLEALERRQEPGQVEVIYYLAGNDCSYIPRYHIKTFDLVSIVVPTKDLGSLLDSCLQSIFEKTTYPNYEVILVDNGSKEPNTFEVFRKWSDKEPNRLKIYTLDIPFNYSEINNLAVKHAEGKYLLFLNNDTQILTADWIEAMVEQVQRESIGCVGGLLLYPDQTVQHAGLIIGLGGVAGTSHKYYHCDEPGYFGKIKSVTNYSAVTGACLMCRYENFDLVGGFDEELAIAFNDVDLCLKMLERGLRNVYLPHVVLYHFESRSRGYEDSPEKFNRFLKESKYFQGKWKHLIDADPCYSPHLSRDEGGYKITL